MAGERDLTWEAMLEVCGYDAESITPSERGRVNAALKELRTIYPSSSQYAVAFDIRARAQNYRLLYPGMPLTPQALTGNWSQIAEQPPPEKPAPRPPVAERDPGVECPSCHGDRIVLFSVRADGSEEYAPCPDCHPNHMAAGFWRHYGLKPGESMRYNPPEPKQVRAAMLRLLEPETEV